MKRFVALLVAVVTVIGLCSFVYADDDYNFRGYKFETPVVNIVEKECPDITDFEVNNDEHTFMFNTEVAGNSSEAYIEYKDGKMLYAYYIIRDYDILKNEFIRLSDKYLDNYGSPSNFTTDGLTSLTLVWESKDKQYVGLIESFHKSDVNVDYVVYYIPSECAELYLNDELLDVQKEQLDTVIGYLAIESNN